MLHVGNFEWKGHGICKINSCLFIYWLWGVGDFNAQEKVKIIARIMSLFPRSVAIATTFFLNVQLWGLFLMEKRQAWRSKNIFCLKIASFYAEVPNPKRSRNSIKPWRILGKTYSGREGPNHKS